jgi:hypothetical protein
MALKHTGRGHNPEGVGAMSPGSLTVECPACPHPSQNLPDNWEQAGLLLCVVSEMQSLYFNILTILLAFFTYYTSQST